MVGLLELGKYIAEGGVDRESPRANQECLIGACEKTACFHIVSHLTAHRPCGDALRNDVPSSVPSTWRRYVRPQDFVWLLFFSALAVFGPGRSPRTIAVLVALGVVQVLEPRIGARISVVLKLALCYLLIGFSYGVSSSFYLVSVSARDHGRHQLRPAGHRRHVAGGLRRLSVLLVFLGENQYIPEDQIPELVLRTLFLPVVGYLTYQLAQANRDEKHKAQDAVGRTGSRQPQPERSPSARCAAPSGWPPGTTDRRPGA